MRYKIFGKSGLRVSELCLGTMTFGTELGWGNTKEESKKVFDRFVQEGGNFFDTANLYTNGTSERFLGEFIASQRKRFVVATKYTMNTDPDDPNAGGNHRKNLMRSVEESLKRLHTDYIDLLWVHAWDSLTPIDEMMRALNDLVVQGKVLYIGASDMPAWVVARANTLAELMGWSPFIALQLEYSLVERSIENDFFQMCQMLDLGLTAWSPLGMGVLTGKYLNAQKEEMRFSHMERWKGRYLTGKNTAITQEVVAIAKERDVSPAQVALRWVLDQNRRTIPIIGAKNVEQLEDNLKSIDLTLNEEENARLDAVSKIPLRFPEEFLARPGVQEIIYGNKLSKIDCLR